MSVFFPAISAAADSREFTFTSDIDQTAVTVQYIKLRSGEWKSAETCVTPCTLRVKLDNIGPFTFKTPDDQVRQELVPYAAWTDKSRAPIPIKAEFSSSIIEEVDDFNDKLSASLLGPDRNAKPFSRLSPSLPPKMQRSGWCSLKFKVLKSGRVSDTTLRDCSEPIFGPYAQAAVQDWIYLPRIKDGQAISQWIGTSFDFALSDDRGRPIPPAKEKP